MLTQQEYQSLDQLLLSPHFSYLEAIHSASHPELVNNPSEVTWERIRNFAVNNLEEFRSVCCDNTPMHITSWFRPPPLNIAVGGVSYSTGSKHSSVHGIWDERDGTFCGVAADIVPVKKTIYYAFRKTPDLKSDFKTFIIYPTKGFIHADTQVLRKKRTWLVSITGKSYVEISEDEARNIIPTLQKRFHLAIDDENPRSGE